MACFNVAVQYGTVENGLFEFIRDLKQLPENVQEWLRARLGLAENADVGEALLDAIRSYIREQLALNANTRVDIIVGPRSIQITVADSQGSRIVLTPEIKGSAIVGVDVQGTGALAPLVQAQGDNPSVFEQFLTGMRNEYLDEVLELVAGQMKGKITKRQFLTDGTRAITFKVNG